MVIESGAGFIVSEKTCGTLWVPPSFTCTVKLEDSAAAGVPLISPALVKVSPAGSVLDSRDHV